MSYERLRNVKTGEIRDIDTNSDEYAELINEVYDHDGSARPKWEITGQHHVRRIDTDEIQEEDLGYEHKPVPGTEVDISELGPEQHPERALTEAEVEMGVESWEQKQEHLNLVREGTTTRREVEPLVRSDPDNRMETGRELAGSVSGKGRRSKGSSRSSGSSGGGSSGGGSSGSSSSGSSSGSGSGSSGSSSSGSSGSSSSSGGSGS